ncbi:Uncharacterised protein [Yersinia ruckeri]|nr:hypothetical protein UGYR_03735 [Yersinia ruckeri]OJB80521.1 hypothetical protein A9Q62_06450 [Yersinia ruckeri]OJB89728.1 hypothetical protein A9Q60_06215 [Yersinia ruckeri]CNB18016.1 Uncharacterised protein [Yersinia ruckeri]
MVFLKNKAVKAERKEGIERKEGKEGKKRKQSSSTVTGNNRHHRCQIKTLKPCNEEDLSW